MLKSNSSRIAGEQTWTTDENNYHNSRKAGQQLKGLRITSRGGRDVIVTRHLDAEEQFYLKYFYHLGDFLPKTLYI